MPSIFCILKFLLIQVYLGSHRFVAVVIQFLIPLVNGYPGTALSLLTAKNFHSFVCSNFK